MATRAQKVRLSIFLIASSSLLLVMFLVLVGNRLLSRSDMYTIEYRDISVTGLEVGAPVKYHGVQVGRVAGLAVKDAATISVIIEVQHKTPVMNDTEAILTLIGITGLKFVELIGGTTDSGLLPPGSTIPAGQSIFDSISGRAEIILGKVEQVLNNLNTMLGPETTASLHRTLDSVAAVSEQTRGILSDNRAAIATSIAHLDTVLIHLATSSEKVDETMAEIQRLVESPDVGASVANVRHITDRLRAQIDSVQIADTIGEFRELVTNSNQMVVHSDLLVTQARNDILRSLSNLEEALDNLRETTDIIRENPSVLIRGVQSSGDRTE